MSTLYLASAWRLTPRLCRADLPLDKAAGAPEAHTSSRMKRGSFRTFWQDTESRLGEKVRNSVQNERFLAPALVGIH